MMKSMRTESNVSFLLVEKGEINQDTLNKTKGLFMCMIKSNFSLFSYKEWYSKKMS